MTYSPRPIESVHPTPASLGTQNRSWQRRASPTARYAFLVMTLLITYASLYPFTDWRDIGVSAFAYLDEPWPPHALEFDMVINVLGYFPLGMLAVFALYPRVRGIGAVLLASGYCAVLSACMEATQTFLAARVASKVDLATNILGAVLGAWFALLALGPILERGRLLDFRRQWFERDASRGLVLCVLWFGAILYPEQFALGCGGFLKPFQSELLHWFGWSWAWEPSSQQFAILEAATTAALLGAAGLILLNLMRVHAPRLSLIFAFVAATVVTKTLGCGITYANLHPLIWLSAGGVAGIGFATVLLALATTASRRARAASAVVLLLLALVSTNLIPDNPYFEAATAHWAYGRFLNFYGLADGLAIVWPLAALAYLLRRWRTLFAHGSHLRRAT